MTEHLVAADPRLAEVIALTKKPRRSADRDPYYALIQSITSQQISVASASAIFSRLLNLFTDRYPHPGEILGCSIDDLRGVGLSGQKAIYIQEAARYAKDVGLSYDQLQMLDDAAVIKELTQIKGVGQWTVEMLLMFPLDRLDVVPRGDVGIQNSMIKHYQLRAKGKAMHGRLIQISNQWKPYRTIACKYLWNWTDSDTQTLW